VIPQPCDDDSFLRLHRAGVFTRAAADAEIRIHFRQAQIFAMRFCEHCLGGAMFGARCAIGFVRDHDALVLEKFRFADFGRLFGGKIEQADRAIGTNFAAAPAIEVAEGVCEIHLRLEKSG